MEQAQSQEECLRNSKFAVVIDVTDGIGRPRTGITRMLRGWLYTIFSAKIVLAAALMGYSFPLVVKSEKASDIFLNCVATLFVLEVDDIVFKLLSSESGKQLFDSFPALRPGAYARHRPWSKLRREYPHVCRCSFWCCSFVNKKSCCACVCCPCCCGCYLSDYVERFFWTCKTTWFSSSLFPTLVLRTNVKNHEDENHVDVWFPIVFEAVLPFFGAMVGVVVAYQYQCVGYIDPASWAQPSASSAGPKVSHCDIHPPPLWGKIPHETGVLSALVTLIIFDPTPTTLVSTKIITIVTILVFGTPYSLSQILSGWECAPSDFRFMCFTLFH